MTNLTRPIDHLVYAVPDLEEAMSWFEKKSGVLPVIGGKHLTKGTKNALVNLGNKCYLELIAADLDNTTFSGNRWMGVDVIKLPKMTRWSLKTNDLVKDSKVLRDHNPEMGLMEEGQRKTTSGEMLNWQMTVPLPEPLVEVVPFITDWSKSGFHPTEKLPEVCTLESIKLYHPTPRYFESIFCKLGMKNLVEQGDSTQIVVLIGTPNGLITLK